MSNAVDFIVERQNLRHPKFVPAPDPESVDVPAEHVLMRVDAFAFTANNVTYAVAGDMLSYWKFFPAGEGWGLSPMSVNLKSSVAADREGEPAERSETDVHRRVIGEGRRKPLP